MKKLHNIFNNSPHSVEIAINEFTQDTLDLWDDPQKPNCPLGALMTFKVAPHKTVDVEIYQIWPIVDHYDDLLNDTHISNAYMNLHATPLICTHTAPP